MAVRPSNSGLVDRYPISFVATANSSFAIPTSDDWSNEPSPAYILQLNAKAHSSGTLSIKVKAYTNKDQSRAVIAYMQPVSTITQVTTINMATNADILMEIANKRTPGLITQGPTMPMPYGIKLIYNMGTALVTGNITGELCVFKRR